MRYFVVVIVVVTVMSLAAPMNALASETCGVGAGDAGTGVIVGGACSTITFGNGQSDFDAD